MLKLLLSFILIPIFFTYEVNYVVNKKQHVVTLSFMAPEDVDVIKNGYCKLLESQGIKCDTIWVNPVR